MTTQTTVANLDSLIKEASAKAARMSGCSDVVFDRHMREAHARLLENAAEGEREAIEALLIEDHEYEPEAAPAQAGAGQCSLTGIDSDCCPCGYHE